VFEPNEELDWHCLGPLQPCALEILTIQVLMPDSNDGTKHSTDSTEVQTRRNWWHGARDFIVSNCPMFDGDNTKLNISENYINADVVVMLNRLISSVDQGGTQGMSDDVN